MSAPVHYALEIDSVLTVPLCENQAGVDGYLAEDAPEMSADDAEVTCAACLRALGYAVPLTEVHGDPLKDLAA